MIAVDVGWLRALIYVGCCYVQHAPLPGTPVIYVAVAGPHSQPVVGPVTVRIVGLLDSCGYIATVSGYVLVVPSLSSASVHYSV